MENTKTVLFKTNYNETSAGDPHCGIPSEYSDILVVSTKETDITEEAPLDFPWWKIHCLQISSKIPVSTHSV